MATWGNMKARIADELARTDLTDQIAAAMKSAVRHYRWAERFWFHEVVSTFTTTASQSEYTDANTSYILLYAPGFDAVTVTDGTDVTPLIRKTHAEILDMDTDSSYTGKPVYYDIYRDRLRLFPTPDDTYTISVHFKKNWISQGFRTFPYAGVPPTGIDDTSPDDLAEGFWTTEAEELIRSRAKVDLFENVIRDFAEADRMRVREMQALQVMRRVADDVNGSRQIVAHAL